MSLLSRTAALANRAIIHAAGFRPVRAAARALFRLLTPRGDVRIPFPGYSIYARTPDRILAALLCKYSLPTSLEAEVYRSMIKPGMTVVEIGANIGFFTLLFSDLAGRTGKVLAYEPDPENYRLLGKSAAESGRSNITARQAAISDKRGRLSLYISEENRGDHRVYECGEGRCCVEVEALSLDEELGAAARVDFIKMDIQGYEYQALLGMGGVVEASPDLAMLCEFTPAHIRLSGHSPEGFLRELQRHGFRLSYLDEASHSVRPASPEEILALCPGEKYLNLLLEKAAGARRRI
jgi:FkbM family methyltransferase